MPDEVQLALINQVRPSDKFYIGEEKSLRVNHILKISIDGEEAVGFENEEENIIPVNFKMLSIKVQSTRNKFKYHAEKMEFYKDGLYNWRYCRNRWKHWIKIHFLLLPIYNQVIKEYRDEIKKEKRFTYSREGIV